MVDGTGRITPTWGLRWDKLWEQAFGGSVSQSTRLVAPTLVPATATTLYTAPGYVQIANASVTNPTGGAAVINVYIVPLGAVAAPANIVATLSVAANTTMPIAALNGQVLNPNETLQASAGAANTLTLIVSGVLL